MERPWRAQGPPQGARGSPPEDRPGAKPQENELKTQEKHIVNAGKNVLKRRNNDIKTQEKRV